MAIVILYESSDHNRIQIDDLYEWINLFTRVCNGPRASQYCYTLTDCVNDHVIDNLCDHSIVFLYSLSCSDNVMWIIILYCSL